MLANYGYSSHWYLAEAIFGAALFLQTCMGVFLLILCLLSLLGMEGSKDVVEQRNKKALKKNFMWTTKKNKFLTSYLAECARNGEKKGKSFGRPIFKKVVEAVSQEFKEECRVDNVESWWKTARRKYGYIAKLREMSGWAWDDNLKMIKVDKMEAINFIEVRPFLLQFFLVHLF